MSKTHKFEPDRTTAIKGFWRPEKKGDSIEGIIVELAGKTNSTFLVLRLTKACDVVSRDRETGDDLDRKAKPDQEVGLSHWASLRGLERHPGRWVKITLLGKKKETLDDGRTITRYELDVDLSDEIVDAKLARPIAPAAPNGARGSKSSRKFAAKESTDTGDDIPF
jgi:hypothetical protein